MGSTEFRSTLQKHVECEVFITMIRVHGHVLAPPEKRIQTPSGVGLLLVVSGPGRILVTSYEVPAVVGAVIRSHDCLEFSVFECILSPVLIMKGFM